MRKADTTEEPVTPPELSILTGLYDSQSDKDAIVQAYWAHAGGDAKTFPVQFSVLLTAASQLMKVYPTYLKKVLDDESARLSADITARHAAFKHAATEIVAASKESKESIDALKETISRTHRVERDARADESRKFASQLSDLRGELPDVLKAAKLVNQVSREMLWSWVAIAFLAGVFITLAVEHLHL